MIATVSVLGLIVLAGLSLAVWRGLDHRADHKVMDGLAANQPENPEVFAAEMVAHLPEPVRR